LAERRVHRGDRRGEGGGTKILQKGRRKKRGRKGSSTKGSQAKPKWKTLPGAWYELCLHISVSWSLDFKAMTRARSDTGSVGDWGSVIL